MERCVRCKKDLDLGSVIITKVEEEKYHMAHFFCATPSEVKALYGRPSPQAASGTG